MTNIKKIRKTEMDKICKCGHRLGEHNVAKDRCLTYPYKEEPHKLCECKHFEEKSS